jgi:hypothetical protein
VKDDEIYILGFGIDTGLRIKLKSDMNGL